MIIHRIGLRNYRAVESRDIELSPGVNIVEGPNEAGKSSLAEALRLIFEYPDSSSHRSVAATHPVHRDEGPEIDLEFETGPYELHYHKRYRRRPETSLEVRRPRPENLTGREAHARAEEILAETIDVALWRALQLQQGSAVEQADLRDREALSRALDAASSSTDGENGDTDEAGALFDRVRAEYRRYYTEKGRTRSERAELSRALEEAADQVGTLEDRERALAGEVAEAERLGASLRDLRRRLPELDAKATELAGAWSEVLERRGELERASRDAESARLRAEAATQALSLRQQLEKDCHAAAERRTQLEKRVESEDGPLRRAEARWKELQERVEQARLQLARCEAHVRSAQGLREIEGLESELDRMIDRIENVDRLESELQSALEIDRSILVDEAGLRALQDAELALRQARARLEEGGARVEVRALADAVLEIASGTVAHDGATDAVQTREIQLGDTLRYAVDDALTLRIPGALEIEIRESRGPAEGESLRSVAERAAAHHQALLTQLRVASIADAVQAHEERSRARHTAGWVRDNLEQVLAGATASELRAEPAAIREALARLRSESAATRASSPEQAPELGEQPTPESLEVACETRDRARAAFEQAEALAETERTGRDELKLAQMRLAGGIEAAVAQASTLDREITSQREAAPDAALVERVREAERESSAAGARAARLQQALDAGDSERLEALHLNAQQVAQAARRDEQEQNVALAAVLARLDTQQEGGLFEELQRARARHSALERDHETQERRAHAAARLYEEMRHQRELARAQYLKPLRERIERLGRIVFGPTFSVALDSALRIESRTLEGRTVEFDSLSTGAQEQIGLLTRLAVAMTVAPEGGVPLVLDDALGNSDPLRLESMGALLSQAGRDCQIIVLTCSPERFRHVGGARVQRISRPTSADANPRPPHELEPER